MKKDCNIKVLIADDEEGTREALKNILNTLKYEIDQVENGKFANDLAKIKNYDFVFLDVNMPEISGVELIRMIRERSPKTVIIMVTGYGIVNESFALSLGADEYVKKPFSIKDIYSICRKYRPN